VDLKKIEIEEEEEKTQSPDFWNDSKNAEQILKKIKDKKRWIESYSQAEETYNDLNVLHEFYVEGESTQEELDAQYHLLETRIDDLEFLQMLSNKEDAFDAILKINPGAGGTESQDWAEMLQRMYSRWAEKRGYKVEIVDYHGGEQAGIKSATLLVKGENAYGYAKTESGVHRLVRISPYDSSARRHTSFSSVWVYPVIDDDIDIEINESDLKIDTYRASGAGGQHVNTTDSAVRITHQPTGIVVASQNDRSQHKNRATAMNMLKARMFEKEMAEREAAASGEYQEKTEIGWGHQIRSYVLQPYQMVKDLRTGVTSPAPDVVLDGGLDEFISAALAQRVTGETVEVEDVE